MSLETGLITALAADSTVNGLVSSRVYPEMLPQSVTYPAIVYSRVSTNRFNKLSGPDGMTKVRLQIDCWDNTYSGVKTLATAVMSALDGVTVLGAQAIQHCYMESSRDLGEVNGDRTDRRVSMDFIAVLTE